MLVSTSRTYFAARNKRDIGSHLIGKLKDCNTLVGKYGVREEEQNAYRHYYGRELGIGITTGAQRDGAQGEVLRARVNLARSLAKALLAIVTGAKMTWRPMARNGEVTAQKANTTAKHLLEDYWKNRGLDRVVSTWTEQAIALAQGFVFPEWDRMTGPTYAALENRLVKQGDITFHNVLPWDVFKDEKRKSAENLDWRFLRVEKNRWDLAKVYHQLSDGKPSLDAILSATDPLGDGGGKDDDVANVYYFFHRPTPSLPVGREIIFLNEQCILFDSKLTYDEVPVYRLAADEMFGTPHGWSQFWDTLGVQELLDGAHEAVANNITTLGNTQIAIEQGTEERPDLNASGVSVWRYPKGGNEPRGINLAKNPPEAFNYLEQLPAWQRQMMGLNDVALGQPQTAQMNAQAFAVLASMAVQQASPLQAALVRAVSALGTGVLKTIRKRVTTERKLQITGSSSKHLFSEESYTGKDIEPVERCVVEVGNPQEQSPTGRTLILQDLMKIMGAKMTPEDYFQVLDTGRLDPVVRAMRDEKLLIQQEYEDLSQAINPPVHTFQNHPLHFRENAGVLHNPEALRNPSVVKAVQAHCDEHYVEFFGLPPGTDPRMDPMYLDRIRLLLGQEPPGVATPPPPPSDVPPDEGGEGGAPPAAPSEGSAPPLPPPPGMPPNPMTGAEFNPTDGGGVVPPPM